METLAPAAQIKHRPESVSAQPHWLTRRRLFWIALAVAIAVYSQTRFWNAASTGDRANWDYIAQVISRGGVPYRDVVNIKSPLSAYISAGAIIVAKPFGIRDIHAIRALYILLAALTVAFTFLVALDYFESRSIALLAAAMMLSFGAVARLNGGGTQPKTPMILFGLMALWAIIKDRPALAGALGMLSALSWQPGLLFVGAAGLAFSRYLTSWRDMKAVKLIAGASLPLAVPLIYFWAAGALKDFYLWNIHFNATIYGPRGVRTLTSFYHRIGKMLAGTYHDGRFYFYLAAPGFLLALWNEFRRAKQTGARSFLNRAPYHGVFIAPLVYALFCVIDIQGGADLIPLLPFAAIFAAVAVFYIVKGAVAMVARAMPSLERATLEQRGVVAIAAIVFTIAAADAAFSSRNQNLKPQDDEVAQIVSFLEPGDEIYVHGQSEILVLSGLTNASKYYLLDRGKDEYLDRILEGGFSGWLQTLKQERPKIVVLNRIKTLLRKREFTDWVRQDYVRRKGRFFVYYVRKDAASGLEASPGDDDDEEDGQTSDDS
jgi:hypothetical protein